MKIENIQKITDIPNNPNNVKIGLFGDNNNLNSLLFFSNLIDDTFYYYNIKEQFIDELAKSNIVFNVLFINQDLNSKNIKLLLNYSKKHGSKIIYAPAGDFSLDSQKELIKKCNFIIVSDAELKSSIGELNSNCIFIPNNIEEEYDFIKQSRLFDEENYISKYQFGTDEGFDSIRHYLTLGVYENCNPFKELDITSFLKLYPEIKKYNITPFTYFIILTQIFKFNGYYSFENIFSHPSISRLVLWDKNNTIIKEINGFLQNEYENDFHFEICEGQDKLLFRQQNELHFKYDYLMNAFSKTNLLIKNRDTGKRILKEIKDLEAEVSASDLDWIGICGIYDIHVQISTFDKDFNFRVKFDSQNYKKILLDKSNQRVFWAYETLDHHLAFKYQEASFAVTQLDVVDEDDNLAFDGEITLLEDLEFSNVELVMYLNQMDSGWEFIDCDYEQYGDIVKFRGDIDFTYYATDVGKKFQIDVNLKDDYGVIVASRVLKEYNLDELKSDLRSHVKKAVFFESFHSQFYSGQPKYIYEKMLEMGLDEIYDFVWAYNGKLEIPGSPLITARGAVNYNDILGASDYWITNLSFPFLKPNEDIVYIQTTHGTPYKKMGADIESEDDNVVAGRVLIESSTWNYLLSPNDFSKDVFARSFQYDGTIINRGYPANDIFYEDTTLKQQELKEELNIDPNKKVILYCPTFRDYDVDESNHKRFSLLLDLKYLYENVHDDYIIIMRLHYMLSKNLVLTEEMKDSIIDLSDYDDIAELYLITDILITDFSSAFFDFAHSKKPILFFVPDYEKYLSFRGLYSEVKEVLPGPEIFTDEELVNCIKNIDDVEKQYEKQYEVFYDKFCGLGHGTAGEDVINVVFKEVNDDE